MNGIQANILVYILLAAISMYIFVKSYDNEYKIINVLNFIMMTWQIFMVVYLVSNYELIIKLPLNKLLNAYEVVDHFIVFGYLLITMIRDFFPKKRSFSRNLRKA